MQSRTILLAALAAATIALSAPAEARRSANFVDAAAVPAYPTSNWVRTARGRHHAGHQPRHRRVAAYRRHHEAREAHRAIRGSSVGESYLSHPAGCPARAFCGCGAAVEVFGRAVRSLWLAANWYQFPRSAPAPGMVAVRRHHVFVLRELIGGAVWLTADYNSGGHRSRLHARSVAGYTIVNPRGRRYASR